tara:strand:- start:1083 stop:1529 length:447 start_codon:yes stop_codon:yes gene_type:complete
MSVRIVRMRNGEDVICDLFEVTTKEKPEDVVAFQLVHPYNVCVLEQEPELVIEGEESNDYTNIHKISDPEINFTPWAPLAKDRKIMLKMEEVVTAYETFEEVITKYNELVEAVNGRGDGADTAGSTPGTDGGSDAPTTGESNPVEATE